MRNRSERRHQDFKAKARDRKHYNACIQDLSSSEKEAFGNNIEKLRKVCVAGHILEEAKKATKKPLRERKHDITMREQMRLT